MSAERLAALAAEPAMNMQDKVAVVTGAASGIGKDIARIFLDLLAAQAVAREFDQVKSAAGGCGRNGKLIFSRSDRN